MLTVDSALRVYMFCQHLGRRNGSENLQYTKCFFLQLDWDHPYNFFISHFVLAILVSELIYGFQTQKRPRMINTIALLCHVLTICR